MGAGIWRRSIGRGPVTAETLFQSGSIDKPVAAMAALRLAQEGKLSLDTDVNQALTSWKIPPSAAAPGAVVKLRELDHTAGLTVQGFPGYAAGTPIPTLVQILNGEQPANTAPLRLEAPPGSRWKYSGGGYTVMQQLLIDVSHEQFAKLMRDAVLFPIGIPTAPMSNHCRWSNAPVPRRPTTLTAPPSRAAFILIPKWPQPDYGQRRPTSRYAIEIHARCAATPTTCSPRR